MEISRLSRILGASPSSFVTNLAAPLMKSYNVTVIRQPQKTLVMVRMRETVAGAAFYLGELLACEALVEVSGKKGFALLAGDDTGKVLSAAVIDAVLKTDLRDREGLLEALVRQEEVLREVRRQEIAAHAKSRVQFATLDTEPF